MSPNNNSPTSAQQLQDELIAITYKAMAPRIHARYQKELDEIVRAAQRCAEAKDKEPSR